MDKKKKRLKKALEEVELIRQGNLPKKKARFQSIDRALYVVNVYAKTSKDSKILYELKEWTLNRLLMWRYTNRIGYHSNGKKHARLIRVQKRSFHQPTKTSNLKPLTLLGPFDHSIKNEKVSDPFKMQF